ncbi:MAG: cysteine hydrolase family protein [Candidatus Micrarchaeia archaeon]
MIVFFDVDTQNDFIKKHGKLAVPNAESILPNLKKLTDFARKKGIRIYASVDRHFGDEEHRNSERELKKWGGPFPEHCMDGTEGQRKVKETEPKNPLYIENRKLTDEEIERALTWDGEIIIEKQTYDVFDNPNTDILLKGVKAAVVYGVATDYCVKAAVLGMRRRGIDVFLVVDAIKAVNAKKGDEEKALEEMRKAGAKEIKTSEVLKGKYF